jgi:hypothetical protein
MMTPLNGFIASAQDATYELTRKMAGPAMILMAQAEFLELVEELREMAAAAPTAKVREALTRMADRYAARAADVGRLRVRSTDNTGAPLAQQYRNRPWGSVASKGFLVTTEPLGRNTEREGI